MVVVTKLRHPRVPRISMNTRAGRAAQVVRISRPTFKYMPVLTTGDDTVQGEPLSGCEGSPALTQFFRRVRPFSAVEKSVNPVYLALRMDS